MTLPSLPTEPPRPRLGEELLERLRAGGPRRDEAAREVHAMLLRAARFELRRRSASLAHVRGEELDDLALQAADDAFVAVMGKLDDFRGQSRFSTWVYKFAVYEAAVRVRRRSWQHREVVLEQERWSALADGAADPGRTAAERELLAAIVRLVEGKLTVHQREVLLALAVEGVPIDVLADRRGTTRGALYKSLHDARRRLRAELHAAGHDLEIS